MAKRRRKAKVYVLPGVERRDMVGEIVPSNEVLQYALNQGVDDVVVVGRQRDGTLYMASADKDVDRTCGRLMRAVGILSNSDFS